MADSDPQPSKPKPGATAKPKPPAPTKPAATPAAAPATPAPGPTPSTIPGVVWLREWTTTAIAGIVVVVTMVILALTFTTAGNTFQERKDILTLALPILGSIIGYYFGRVPAERRAEAAEGKLDDAQATAETAAAAANQATQHAAEKDRKLGIAKKGLEQVKKATAGAAARPAGAPAPEGAGGSDVAGAAQNAHVVASTILDHLDG